MYDCHLHLHTSDFQEYCQWRADGLEGAINASIHEADWNDVVATASWPGMTAAIGVHPWYSEEFTDATARNLAELLEVHPQLLIGEIGLDFRFHPETKEIQQKIFRTQLELAQRFKRTAIIHLLWAGKCFLRIMEEFTNASFIVHGCSEEASVVRKIIQRFPNSIISFGFNLCRENNAARIAAVQCVPPERRCTDSDYPYMALPGEKLSTPTKLKKIEEILQHVPFVPAR